MYTWFNFLWACKNCNTEKLAVFPIDTNGNAVLLNPTVEEPLDYLGWDDISGKTIPNPDPVLGFRAEQTRDLLKLDQFSLAEERRIKLANVVYLLSRVVGESPIQPDTMDRLQDELAPHRPWLGIVRQLFRRPSPKYKPLVEAARKKSHHLEHLVKPWLDAKDRA